MTFGRCLGFTAVLAASVLLLAHSAAAMGGTISIVCIDWYLTTGPDNHIHAEGFLQDENGDPVIGAQHHHLQVCGVQPRRELPPRGRPSLRCHGPKLLHRRRDRPAG